MHKMLKSFFVGISLLIVAICYVVFIGFEINSKYINDKITRELSESLGRQVSIEGPVIVRVSMMPSVSLHGLHVANPEEFSSSATDFLYLKEAHLSLNLWGLFKNQLTIQKVSGAGLDLALIEKENGRNNWTFKSSPEDPQGLANILELLEHSAINDINFETLNVSYQQANQPMHHFNLDLMQASIPSRQKISVALKGKVEKTFPYNFLLNADSLTNLAAAIKTVSATESRKIKSDALPSKWNFQAQLNFLNSQSRFAGGLYDNAAHLNLDLLTPDLEKFGKILDTSFPNIGLTKIKSELIFAQDLIQVKDFKATFANTEVNGDFNMQIADKPTIKGEIYLPSIDLTPFLAYSSKNTPELKSADQPQSFVQVYKQLLGNDFDLAILNKLNVDIALKLDQLYGMPADIKNGQLKVKLVDGKLLVPMQIDMAGVSLSGQLDAYALKATEKKRPTKKCTSLVKLHLLAKHQDIADLGRVLTGVSGLKGQLGNLDIVMAAEGEKLGEAFENLTLKARLDNSFLSYGNNEGGKPVDFSISRFDVDIQPHQSLSSNFVGTLLNQPINMNITGDALSEIVKSGQSHYQLNAHSKSATVSMQASSSMLFDAPTFDLRFKMNATDSTDLASWLGLQSKHPKIFALDGDFHVDDKQWKLEHVVLKLGHSDFELNAQRANSDKTPLILVGLSSDHIDYAELKMLLPDSAQVSPQGKDSKDQFRFNIPILPQGVDLRDAKINIALKKIDGIPLLVKNVDFKINIKNGFIGSSPFSFDINEIHNRGSIYLDLRSADPVIKLWFASNQVNIGNILQQLKISQKVDARFEHFALYVESHSALLGDLIGQAKVLGDLSNGVILIEEPQTKKTATIQIDKGGIFAAPHEKLALVMAGSFNENPINIKVDTGQLEALMDVTKRVPFALNAQVAKTELNLAGSLSRKLEDADLELQLKVNGEKLSNLNRLLGIDVPSWGPWSLSGVLKTTNKSYEISDFDLQVGLSALKGRGELITSINPVKLNINLIAPQIRLDDFRVDGWGKSKDAKTDLSNKDTQKEMSGEALSQKVEQFLSPTLMRSLNIDFNAKVDRVVSGNDKLGKGSFDFLLNNGQATIGPVSVETDKGRALGWLKYQPQDKNVQMDFHLDVDRFDYGIIARYLQPKSDVKGRMNLKVDVSSQASHLSELWKYAGGDLDFAVLPENQKAGVFDLWAVNILTGLLPVVDPSKESKVNCAIGKFQLKNGVVREQSLQIDTSRMRVTGVLYADLKAQKIFAKVRPQAKEAQFFSLSTPIEVTGSFDKFKIGPSLVDVAETALRIGTSVVWVPLKKLFSEKMLMDGADICPSF